MKLLTKEIEKALPKMGATKGIPMGEKIAVAKFFYPAGRLTWYAVEGEWRKKGPEEHYVCWGWVEGHCDEWGAFSLTEFESTVGPGGLKVERDKSWKPTKMSEILPEKPDSIFSFDGFTPEQEASLKKEIANAIQRRRK